MDAVFAKTGFDNLTLLSLVLHDVLLDLAERDVLALNSYFSGTFDVHLNRSAFLHVSVMAPILGSFPSELRLHSLA